RFSLISTLSYYTTLFRSTGEQRKVKDKTHRVPISEEIAKIVLTQKEITIRKSNSETNPLNFLFPTYGGTRKGQPISRENVVNNLDRKSTRLNSSHVKISY